MLARLLFRFGSGVLRLVLLSSIAGDVPTQNVVG